MKKYVLHPGTIKSRTDNQEHYIRAADLARLYHIPLGECITIIQDRPETWRGRDFTGMVHLYPRENGDYTLEET